MIRPASAPGSSDVARHYDALADLYRDAWGEHLHHGVWIGDRDASPVEMATLRLLYLAVRPLRLCPGQAVADIGCGSGGTARWLAETFGAEVTGLTLSPRQLADAVQAPPPSRGAARYHLADWLTNDLPGESFDAAVAIESLAHMTDKGAFFRQLHRTLKPGGKAAVACWLAVPDPHRLERRLLEGICGDGCLPGMASIDEYVRLAEDAGLRVGGHRDLSAAVERTWSIIARRLAAGLLTKRRYGSFLVRGVLRGRTYLLTLPRLMLAYRTGALRYALVWCEKPD